MATTISRSTNNVMYNNTDYDTEKNDIDRIKYNIRDSYDYFKDNYLRFQKFTKFVCKTSLDVNQINLLNETGKPVTEFNILEAYISRQLGEFSKQEPSFMVSPSDDCMIVKTDDCENVDPQLIDFLDGHFRAILDDANKDSMQWQIYKEQLIGGFSVMKVITEYTNEMSFNQNICWRKVFHPTLCGFDKMARESHKGDGRFCFEIIPTDKEQFEEEYGKEFTDEMKFGNKNDSVSFDGFSWTYKTSSGKNMILVCHYYEKKNKKIKIVRLSNGLTMDIKKYDKYVSDWNNDLSNMMAAPVIVGEPRKTIVTKICRYIIVETGIVEYVETDYKYLPLIFCDGNSVELRDGLTGSNEQITRPYVYHAMGIQNLKNFAGISLANALENMVQSQWIAPKEGIPAEYKEPYIEPQKASILIFNAFKDNNPNVPLPPPQAVVRSPAPPEVMSTFSVTDEMTQVILGSYDASLGINNNQLSGIAIQEGATQSNATAMPYIVGNIQMLNRAAEITLDLIPKYYLNPRNVAIKNVRGKKSHVRINDVGTLQMDFQPEKLNVKVEAGVNYEIQRTRSLNMLIQIMQVSEKFKGYMETAQGLNALLDNLDIRGIDGIKQGVDQFIQKMDIQQQQAQQMAQQMQMQQMQSNPMILKSKELDIKERKNMADFQIETSRIAVEKQEADTDRLDVLAKTHNMITNHDIQQDKIDAENARTSVESTVKIADSQHKQAMDLLGLHHKNDQFHKKFTSEGEKMTTLPENFQE